MPSRVGSELGSTQATANAESRVSRVSIGVSCPRRATVMSPQETPCYTVVFEDSSESPTTQELRDGLQKGSDDVKFDTLRKIIVSTINGNPQVRRRSVMAYVEIALKIWT